MLKVNSLQEGLFTGLVECEESKNIMYIHSD